MQRNTGQSRAQIEQARRQHAFYQRQAARAEREKSGYYKDSSGGLFNSDFSEYKMRRIAPFAALIYLITALFLVTWLVTKFKSNVGNFNKPKTETELPKINITQPGLYHFEAEQNFTNLAPQFSELEIEIIDQNYNHVYSVYKDLWQEKFPNENGALQTYRDLKVKFDLELNNPGLYYLRTVSHNQNNSYVYCSVSKKTGGSLYFGFYTILCLILCAILIVGSAGWGTPAMMMRSLKKSRSIKANRLFLNVAIISISIYALCLIFSITHYGYPSTGKDSNLPTHFLSKDKTIYLG
jgi:hypothetical protein